MSKDKAKLEVVSAHKVSCSGELNDPSQGHPVVWLQIPEEIGYVTCPYCEKKFVYDKEKSGTDQSANEN